MLQEVDGRSVVLVVDGLLVGLVADGCSVVLVVDSLLVVLVVDGVLVGLVADGWSVGLVVDSLLVVLVVDGLPVVVARAVNLVVDSQPPFRQVDSRTVGRPVNSVRPVELVVELLSKPCTPCSSRQVL